MDRKNWNVLVVGMHMGSFQEIQISDTELPTLKIYEVSEEEGSIYLNL